MAALLDPQGGLAISPGALTSASQRWSRQAATRAPAVAMIVALCFAASPYWLYSPWTPSRGTWRSSAGDLISGSAVRAVMTVLSSAAASSLPPLRFAAHRHVITAASWVAQWASGHAPS